MGVPWGLRQAPCWQRWEPTGVGAHPASGQPHAGHHTAQRRGQKWVAIYGKSPVAGIWSASWQSPPRVTGPWGQIPRGPIQTLMTVPQPSSWGWPPWVASQFNHLPPSAAGGAKFGPEGLWGKFRTQGRDFLLGDPHGALHAACKPLFHRGFPSAPRSGSVPQTYPETQPCSPCPPSHPQSQGRPPCSPHGPPLTDGWTKLLLHVPRQALSPCPPLHTPVPKDTVGTSRYTLSSLLSHALASTGILEACADAPHPTQMPTGPSALTACPFSPPNHPTPKLGPRQHTFVKFFLLHSNILILPLNKYSSTWSRI